MMLIAILHHVEDDEDPAGIAAQRRDAAHREARHRPPAARGHPDPANTVADHDRGQFRALFAHFWP
jgi:hypothetical protein